MKYKMYISVRGKTKEIFIETKNKINEEIPEMNRLFKNGILKNKKSKEKFDDLIFEKYKDQFGCDRVDFILCGWDLIKEKENGTEK